MAKKKRKAANPPSPTAGSAHAVLWLFMVVIVLQLIGLVWPSRLTWGFGFWHVFPVPWPYLAIGVGLILLVPGVNARVAGIAGRVVGPIADMLARIPLVISGSVSSVLLLALFYVFRSRALVYGDGYLVLRFYTSTDSGLLSNIEVMKPLSAPFYKLLYKLIIGVHRLPPADAITLISALGGVVGFWALYRLSTLLSENRRGKWFLLFAAMTSGTIMLFFGYVENYTWATSLALWSLALSVGYSKGVNRLWPALLLAIVATGFHVTAVIFIMVAVLAWMFRNGIPGRLKRSQIFRWSMLTAVTGSVIIAVLAQVAPKTDYLVLVWPITFNHYWILSPGHIIDMVNIAVLVAPIAVVAMLFTLKSTAASPNQKHTEQYVLASAALLALIAAFWINPELGAPRDWDLLSSFGFPASLWGAHRLLNRFTQVATKPGPLLGAVVVCAICIVPNVTEKTNLNRAMDRLDSLLWEDPHYQTDYKHADRCAPWAFTMHYDAGCDPKRTIRYYRRTVTADPNSYTGWFNLGDMYMAMGDFKSAYHCLTTSIKINPKYIRSLSKLSELEVQMRRPEDAIEHARQAVALDPNEPITQTDLGIALALTGDQEEALKHFRRAYDLQPDFWERYVNLGLAYSNVNQDDSALVYLRDVLTAPPNLSIRPSVYAALAEVAITQRDYAVAEQALAKYRLVATDAERARKLTEMLRKAKSEKQ